MRWFLLTCIVLAAPSGAVDTPESAADARPRHASPLSPEIFQRCAFVSVDIQEGAAPQPITDEQVPALWKRMGIGADDVNAANVFGWEVALPNAVKVADACRDAELPRIFLHWGYRFEDGMDLDPEVRKAMLEEHGTNYGRWSGHIGQAGSQPAKILGIRDEDYVLPKTAQDAFRSSSIDFVLRNLEIETIVFVGGHTGACLGKTARSAQEHGYTTLCIRDATNNARESTREKDIEETGYDYVMTTQEFIDAIASFKATNAGTR